MRDGTAVDVDATIELDFKLLSDPSPWRVRRVAFDMPEGASRPIITHAEFPPDFPHAEPASAMVFFDIDQTGVPVKVRVASLDGPNLDKEITAAVRGWRFRPGMAASGPVSVRCTLTVVRR